MKRLCVLLLLSACAGPAVQGDEVGAAPCADGVDNDRDGEVDCDDEGCAPEPRCALVEEERGGVCFDGEDNDHDGRADCADPGCFDETRCGAEVGLACGDSVDNDGDGEIDCDDESCATEPGCGGAPPPVELDTDGDGLLDDDELRLGTDPTSADSDDDGVLDADEVGDVNAAADRDGDGRIDALEPDDGDCDGDGRPDPDDPRDLDRDDDDRDLDGVPNAMDIDDDADGLCDPGETGPDCVGEDRCPWSATTCVLRGDEPAPVSSCASGACPLVIEEVLYRLSTAGGATLVDANGDGVGDASEDEFVELRNASSGALDISGVRVFEEASFGGGAPRHEIPAGTLLQPGERLVIFGGGVPALGEVRAQVASSGQLGLNNGGDEVFVIGPGGELITSLRLGAEDAPANVSFTRYPEGALQLLAHDVVGLPASPGRCPDL